MARNLIAGDRSLKVIKPGDPRKRVSDGDGLYLRLFVNGGSHGWRFDYSHAGKRLTISLGTYPDTGLARARTLAEEARQQLLNGVDPSAARQEHKLAQVAARELERREQSGLPSPGSFEAVAREWLEHVHAAKVSAGHAERTRIRFEQDAFPWIGHRPIAEIEAPELLKCLRRVEARGAIETAHRLKDACGQVFRYGVATGACKRSPAGDLKDALRPVQVRHYAAVIEPKMAGELLVAIDGYQGHPITRDALVLSALLLLRPGELRHLEWRWVDLDSSVITIPGQLMKRKKADKPDGPSHVVPLATQAVAVLKSLMALTGQGRYVFPSLLTDDRPMSENTVNTALRRMGYDRDTATAHGFRATARTMIAERLGIEPEVIEAQLAHAVSDALGRAYNRTRFMDQRRQMMQRWADYLDDLRSTVCR